MHSADTTMRSVTRLTTQLAQTTAHMDSVIAGIQNGRGTLGKMANDSTLYVDMRKTLESLSAMIDDLKKNPGKLGITIKIF
jgi:phospholipid/cholesterol/gamma-HCH transport system substrate-binding protein